MTNIADLIIAPQGAEYQAVNQGLKTIKGIKPQLLALPMGIDAVSRFLAQSEVIKSVCTKPQPRVILLGVCGSLSSEYQVAETVIYQNCVYLGNNNEITHQECDRALTQLCQQRLDINSNPVTALTSDRFIESAITKRQLGQKFAASVVDMEGFAILDVLSKLNLPNQPQIAMIRVISDDCSVDLPDISSAIAPNGSLKPLTLANIFLRHPVGAARLIRDSLKALKVLQTTVTTLLTP